MIALIILADFVIPAETVNEKIIKVEREIENYYNAGGNSHNTYKVITNSYKFSVEEDFAKLARGKENISFGVSMIFNKVNWYTLNLSNGKSFHSLRIASGFVLPLLFIIAFFVAHRFKKNINTIVLILKVLLIIDIIYLWS
ncbi:hypothetical protein [Tenacibaculum sp. 190130A14a]